jgi:hypothetical protein
MENFDVLPVPARPVNVAVSRTDAIIAGDMLDAANFRKTMIEMINAVNLKKYTVINTDFRNPARLPDDSIRNTQVMLVELPDVGLFNPKPVQYNRIHTDEVGLVKVQKGTATTVLQLLNAVNTQYNKSFREDEVVDANLPNADSQGFVSFKFAFEESSMRYYSGLKVKLRSNSEEPGAVERKNTGLEFVDNTPDNKKPVSIFQKQAIDDAVLQTKTELKNEFQQDLLDLALTTGTGPPLWAKTEW